MFSQSFVSRNIREHSQLAYWKTETKQGVGKCLCNRSLVAAAFDASSGRKKPKLMKLSKQKQIRKRCVRQEWMNGRMGDISDFRERESRRRSNQIGIIMRAGSGEGTRSLNTSRRGRTNRKTGRTTTWRRNPSKVKSVSVEAHVDSIYIEHSAVPFAASDGDDKAMKQSFGRIQKSFVAEKSFPKRPQKYLYDLIQSEIRRGQLREPVFKLIHIGSRPHAPIPD